jgi:type IV pilus assembly protein PilA
MLQAMFKKIGKSKKGFTLIELLVVIAILGILAAIMIPLVSGYITTSRQSVANADARTVFSAACTIVAQHPDTTYSGYSATAVAGKISDTDLAPYLGTRSFTIDDIKFDGSGNVTEVDISADHGASGKYVKS